MAPEQVMGSPCFSNDQYALAVVLHELLCGIAPFEGTKSDVIKQHLHANPPLIREHRLTIPLAVEDVFIQALAKDPKRRYDCAGQFAMAIEQGARVLPRAMRIFPHEDKSWRLPTTLAKPITTRRCPSRPENKTARWFAIAAMCFGDLVAAALFWFLSTLLHSDIQIVAWLVAFCALGCVLIGAIIMKRWPAR